MMRRRNVPAGPHGTLSPIMPPVMSRPDDRALARRDAKALLDFLALREFGDQSAPALPTAQNRSALLAGSEPITVPRAG
jgi:hypothetical protein